MRERREKTGIVSKDELAGCPGMPTKNRMDRGPVAVIECVQEIPCDPCVQSCPHHAIEIGEEITGLPRLIEDKCTGCGLCIAPCPGQAIFVVDMNHSPERGMVMIPYEFSPLPKIHSTVKALDREGKVVGEARVVKVGNPKRNNRTPVISLLVPRDLVMDVRNIRF